MLCIMYMLYINVCVCGCVLPFITVSCAAIVDNRAQAYAQKNITERNKNVYGIVKMHNLTMFEIFTKK